MQPDELLNIGVFNPTKVDLASLHLIEEALLVYNSVSGLVPEAAPEVLRRDCAVIDLELMRLPFEQAGLSDHCGQHHYPQHKDNPLERQTLGGRCES